MMHSINNARTSCKACWVLMVLAALFFASLSLHAAEPIIRTLDIRGLRVGGTTSLVLDGDDLGKAPRLLLPFAATQVLKPGSTDKRAAFDVTLDPSGRPVITICAR